MDKKAQILAAIRAFAAQRSGIDPGNYHDWKSFRAEQRSITKDLTEARQLIRRVELSDSITAEDLMKAAERAYSGRLSIVERYSFECMSCEHKWKAPKPAPGVVTPCPKCDQGFSYMRPDAIAVDYCTGQYFPTEYRKAVCAVMASALWHHVSAHCMPTPLTQEGPHHSTTTYLWHPTHTALSAGAWIRAYFKREYGRGIQSRWFS